MVSENGQWAGHLGFFSRCEHILSLCHFQAGQLPRAGLTAAAVWAVYPLLRALTRALTHEVRIHGYPAIPVKTGLSKKMSGNPERYSHCRAVLRTVTVLDNLR